MVEEVETHVWVVHLLGEHDLTTVPAVREAIDEVFAAGSQLVLDASRLEFIDSTVLSAVLRGKADADAEAAHGFVIVAPEGSPARELLRLVHAEARIEIYETLDAAIAAVTPR